MDRAEWETVRCPTCRAVQPWSDTCRRCRCDLRLLREVVESYRQTRRRCLLEFRAGRAREVVRLAQRCEQLRADDESQRLVALGMLLVGDWPAAAALGRRLVREGGPAAI